MHVSQPTTGGVAAVVAHLAEAQVAHRWEVAVVSPNADALPSRVEQAGAWHVMWSARRAPGLSVLREAHRLRRAVAVIRPDIVHLHSSKAALVGRLVLRGRIPTVVQPHGWSFLAASPRIRALTVMWERLAARWADRIVCVSSGELNLGRDEGVRARWSVVPNWVDVTACEVTSPARRRQARQRLGLPDVLMVTCAGRLSYAKGQDVLLQAWRRVRGSTPDARLLLVGDGEGESVLRARADPSVLFAGSRDDVSEWLLAADVVVIPSRWEAGSLVALEAAASGCCVVASDVPGMAEAFGGDHVALVRPGDAAALSRALIRRLEDPNLRDEEGAAHRRYAEQRSLEPPECAFARLYVEVLEQRARRAVLGTARQGVKRARHP